MVDQASSHAALTNAVGTYYSKKILQDFEPKTTWYVSAPVMEPIPEGEGNIVTFTRYNKITPLRSDDSTQFAAQQMYLSAEVINGTLHERDGYVQVSRYAKLTARGRLLDRAADKVKNAAAKTLDLLVRNDIGMMIADVANASSLNYSNMAIDGGTLNSTGKTARIWSHDRATGGDRFPVYHNKTRVAQSALVTSIAKTALTVKSVAHAVSELEDKDIPPLSSGYYKLITRPKASYQIVTSPGFKGWISPTSSEGMRKRPTEVGVVAGVMVETSTLAYAFPLSADTLSTSSGTLYASLLFGDEAYGVAEISGANGRQGFSFFLKESGPQSTNDPTNKIKQAAFSITSVAKVLNKSAGAWILSTEIT